jgi:predicted RNA-binding Zn-ribbon protein involved in translation (DUF1610 family)
MKIPKEDAVRFVVRSVLKQSTAGSQEEFRRLVIEELRKADPEYTISGKRLRGVAVSLKDVKMKTHVRKGRLRKKCPSCGSGLSKSYTRNLRGRKVLDRTSCRRCGYRGQSGKWVPSKYEFRS